MLLVNQNKIDMQNLELLRAIGNCFACQVCHTCRRLLTPPLEQLRNATNDDIMIGSQSKINNSNQ